LSDVYGTRRRSNAPAEEAATEVSLEIGASVVTEAARKTYDRDGVVLLQHAFAPAHVRALADRMNIMVDAVLFGKLDLITSRAPGRVEVYNAVRREQLFRNFVFRSVAAEIAARITGSQSARFYFDVTFCKVGGNLTKCGAAATSWHHDVASFAFKGRQLPSLWLALTDAPPDAGPLVFALGSHTNTETLFRASGDYPDPPMEGYRDHAEVIPFIVQKEFEMKSFPAKAGDVIIIDPYVLHGSAPVTNGTRRRLGFCTRWMGDDVTWQPSPYTMVENRSMRSDLAVGSKPPDESFPVTWPRPC
jgi:ectoine hydroxylase-related dioxygenase (phytanoyl-CoA dioxygenase family)